MNGLFSLKSILNENTAFKSMIQSPVSETYLNSALDILERFDTGIAEATSLMYSQIAEATSRSEENNKFAEYFKTYKSLVNGYARDMNELVSKATINIGNYVDANKSTIDNADGMSVTGEPSIKVYDFKNLDNDDVPHIDIEKAFKKEFKFIGKMMQDLGSAITNDEAKANVLATVCNNLQSEIQDDWVEKCMCKIADYDEDTDCKKTNFASMMYKKFIPEDLHDMNITDGDIQQARLALMNASTLVAGLERANDEFASGLENIANEIGAMFFRNQDNNMPVKTDAEGIADRNYKLSASGFNQFNIFMANKCTQITELCNLYLIAISIKADMIYKYLKQCVDIIDTANMGIDNTPNTDDINTPEDDISDDGESGDDEPDDLDDNTSSDMDFNPEMPDDTESSDDNSVEEPEDSDKHESELDEAAYLFESVLFDIDRAYLALETGYLTEDNIPQQQDQNGNNTDVKDNSGQVIAGTAEASSSKVANFIKQLKELLDKFISVFKDTIGPTVDTLKKNGYAERLKKTPIPNNGWTIDFTDTAKLMQIQVQKMNIRGDGGLLDDQNKYIESKWNQYLGEGKSLKDRIYNKLTKVNIAYTETERDAGIDFLLNYQTNMAKIENEKKSLENEQKNINRALKESAEIGSLEESMAMYFNEQDNMPANSNTQQNQQQDGDNSNNQQNNQNQPANNSQNQPNTKPQQGNDIKQKQTRINNYYAANVKILAAKMGLMQQVAKQHINFLDHLSASANMGTIRGKGKKNKADNNSQNNNQNTNQNQQNNGNDQNNNQQQNNNGSN